MEEAGESGVRAQEPSAGFANEVKYPHIEVQLTGTDGNAFALMGVVSEALRDEGVSGEEIDQFRAECMSGDYDNLLRTCTQWVTVS